jgi:hypothetical protein
MQRICKFGENKSVRSKTSKLFIRRPLARVFCLRQSAQSHPTIHLGFRCFSMVRYLHDVAPLYFLCNVLPPLRDAVLLS